MRAMLRQFGLLIAPLFCPVSCQDFDASRVERPFEREATLGQEVFGGLCDRVGASVLLEDIEGRSYHAMCHPDERGGYTDTVDTSLLPPVNGAAAAMRNLSVAKLEKLAERRSDIIRAIDVLIPDVEINDPYVAQEATGTKRVRLYDALADLVERLSPLYDSNPLEAVGGIPGPLLPAATQASARVLRELAVNGDALDTLTLLGGRKGYRPTDASLGVIQPVLAYPALRAFAQDTVRMLSPGGPARDQYVRFVGVFEQELRTAERKQYSGLFYVDDPSGIAQPNRPRDNIEILQSLLLATDPSFSEISTISSGPAYAVLRDYRGFALSHGSIFGRSGSVSIPFADSDGDGLADVDAFGRVLGPDGKLAVVDTPFPVPGRQRVRAADSFGRALLDNGELAYQYIDTSETVAAALMRDLSELADPDLGDEAETLMYAIAGLPVLFGDRVPGQKYTYGQGADAKTVEFTGFDPNTSPLVDFAHAFGQVLADPQGDDFLVQMIDLFENHENVMARVVGMALELKRISDQYPDVNLRPDAVFWDHLISVFVKVVSNGVSQANPDEYTLLEDLLLALTNDDALGLSHAYSSFMTYRDVMTYNKDDINGKPWNKTTNNTNPPSVPVDRSKPENGDNMSMFHRSMQIVFDSTGTTACNKFGAKLNLEANLLPAVGGGIGASLVYPDNLVFVAACMGARQSPLGFCDVYRIEDLTKFYLQSVVEGDPKLPASANKGKATLVVRDRCLNSLDWATDMDDAFQKSSGITGMTTHPTHQALNRLVFFGADSSFGDAMDDLDVFRNTLNAKVNRFISDLQDPMGTPLCSKNPVGVNVCSTAANTLRMQDPGTLFLWEQFGFVEANRPVLYVFYKHDREDLFAELIDVVYYHLPGSDHGSECSKTGSWNRQALDFNPRYCAETGIVKYEPMMAQQLNGDLIPAMHALLKVVADQRIESKRYRANLGRGGIQRRGSEVMASMARVLLDPGVSAQNGVAYRNGQKSTTWNDGATKVEQTTPFYMLAEALDRFDSRFATAKDYDAADRSDRRAQWKRARSQLVDQFLEIEGQGANARFKNRAISKIMAVGLRTLREQLNANCPDREKGVSCEWAKHEMANKVADVIADPFFAVSVDLVDELRKNPNRVELGRFLKYLLGVQDSDDTMRKVLVTVADALQVFHDEQRLPPLLNALSSLSATDDGVNTGMADIALQLLNVLSRDADAVVGLDDPLLFDRYRVFDQLAVNLAKPIDASQPSDSVLEVLLDAILDVHRYDSVSEEPLSVEDWGVIADSMINFLTDESRGIEQLYEVVRRARGN